MNFAGGDKLAISLPTHESFEPHDIAARHIEHWLVVQPQLVALESLPKVAKHLQPLGAVTRAR